MVAGDPYKSGTVAVQDQLRGHLSGFTAWSDGRTVQQRWENDSLHGSAGMAISYQSGQLDTDSLGQIFIGPNNSVYYTATDTRSPNGYVTRVTIR